MDLEDARLWTATQGAGSPVVLCSGGPGDSDHLSHVAAMIEDMALVHRFDPRACGRSTGGPPFTLLRAVEDLDSLRQHWGHAAWTLIGHSFGALVALAYAALHPEHTRAVAYVSCLIAPASELSRALSEFRLTRDQRGEIGDVGDPALRERIERTVARMTKHTNAQVNRELGADGMRYCSTPAFQGALARIDVPVLLVHGERDPRPMWAVERLARTLLRGSLVRMPGVGHFPDLEAPERYRTMVRGFLEDLAT